MVILPDRRIIDGRHRHESALELGLSRVPCRVEALTDPIAIECYALQAALASRHLTPAQKVQMAEPLTRAEAEHAELRRRATLKQFDGRLDALPAGTPVKGKTLERVAKMIGISTRVAERIKTVMDHGPAGLFEQLVRGEVRPDAAYRKTVQTLGQRSPRAVAPPRRRKTAQRSSASRSSRAPAPPPRPRLRDATVGELEGIGRRVGAWLKESPRWAVRERAVFYASLGVLAESVRQLVELLTPYLHDVSAEWDRR